MVTEGSFGTANRNHCPACLWSKHMDEKESGDRKATCMGMMEPIGLTFKKEGLDKYGKERQGEIMLVHKCEKCGKVVINRIAGDDQTNQIMSLFEKTQKNKISKTQNIDGVRVLGEEDRNEVRAQLYGKGSFGYAQDDKESN